MKEQHFKNHMRMVPGFHGFSSMAILALLVGSIINLCNSARENLYSASLICLVAVILVFLFWYTRSFALRVQDRAIRAEENFRHYILTGKTLPAELRLSQIIALRFAPDEEFVELVKKALSEKMTSKEIKMAIQKWKADYHRA
ncbi:MAG: hypothetical protein RLZZ28_700 [Bacteroidota bacterium]|jgi:hypothetical protein